MRTYERIVTFFRNLFRRTSAPIKTPPPTPMESADNTSYESDISETKAAMAEMKIHENNENKSPSCFKVRKWPRT